MKKFSTIAKVEVGQEPKPIKEVQETTDSDTLRFAISNMIDEFLTIGFDGPYTTEYFQQTSKIEGREIFIEALLNALKDKDIQKEIKVLESLKSSVRDHQAIDEKIDTLHLLLEKQTPGETAKHKKRVEDLLKKEDPIKMAELQASRITDGEKSYFRYMMAKSLRDASNIERIIKNLKKEKIELSKTRIAKLLNEIADIFKFKADQLGYKG
jgi:hypothetical protein